MRLATNVVIRTEYHLCRRNLASPFADVRGHAGRTRAIAAAIRTGLARGDDPDSIDRSSSGAEARYSICANVTGTVEPPMGVLMMICWVDGRTIEK
ncbi:hypothetical protein MLGJGCBP_00800 [Rhodococcus sp. T7]|nr:hypothetical protein MLGJGCBP_00800 [Rhodococcus sp. T7]